MQSIEQQVDFEPLKQAAHYTPNGNNGRPFLMKIYGTREDLRILRAEAYNADPILHHDLHGVPFLESKIVQAGVLFLEYSDGTWEQIPITEEGRKSLKIRLQKPLKTVNS